MAHDLEPNPANEPPRSNKGPNQNAWHDLIMLGHKLIERFSEEAVVILAVLLFKSIMEFRGAHQPETYWIAFVALGGYLSLRLLKMLLSTRS
jgi:uncharacterized membrane protein YqhA